MTIRVLLVDDSKDFIKYMKKRLEVRGISVATAFSGEEALEVIQDQPVDVVVLDYLMPGIDGIETLRELKKLKPEVGVIMLTGHGTVETAAEGMKLGASDFLQKPCDLDSLLNSIQKTYEKRSVSSE